MLISQELEPRKRQCETWSYADFSVLMVTPINIKFSFEILRTSGSFNIECPHGKFVLCTRLMTGDFFPSMARSPM